MTFRKTKPSLFFSELVSFQHGLMPSSFTFPQNCMKKDIADLRIYPSLRVSFFLVFLEFFFMFLIKKHVTSLRENHFLMRAVQASYTFITKFLPLHIKSLKERLL